MGIFDILTAKAQCPFCGHWQDWKILYKYGDCLKHEKSLGDKIEWSKESMRFYDYGDNVGGNVQVPGVPEDKCQSCGVDRIYCIIAVKDNVIKGIELFENPVDVGKEGYRKIR